MSLIVCPECGREKVSDKAVACPDCGFPIAEHFSKLAAEAQLENTPENNEPAEACGDIIDEAPAADVSEDAKMPGSISGLCELFLEKIGSDADSFQYTPKLKKGLGIPDEDTVYLAHDDTLFKSGKNGFVFTDKGIYCKHLTGSTDFTSWDELAACSNFVPEEHFITANGKSIIYYTDSNDEVYYNIRHLLDSIRLLLSGNSQSFVPLAPSRAAAAVITDETTCFYMKQKAVSITPKFDIMDENGNAVYHVEGDLMRLNFSIQKNGVEVLTLKKKLATIMSEYTILKDNMEIANIKKKFRLTAPELGGQVNGAELKINGDLLGYDFDILVGGTMIGHVEEVFGDWTDCYGIYCQAPEMQDIMIALAIICDSVADNNEESD